MAIDPVDAGAAFVAYWLRGRYGNVGEIDAAPRRRRWRVEPASTGRPVGPPFEIEVEAEALSRDLGNLREWLESVAEDAAAQAPESPGSYSISALSGVTRSTGGRQPETVHPAG